MSGAKPEKGQPAEELVALTKAYDLVRELTQRVGKFRRDDKGRPIVYHVRIPPRGGWGLVEQTSRVLRGGSWNNDNPDNFRCANRNDNDPDNRNHNNGFRVSSTIPCQSPDLYGGQERVGRVQTGSRPQGQISKWRGAAGSPRGRTSSHAFSCLLPFTRGRLGGVLVSGGLVVRKKLTPRRQDAKECVRRPVLCVLA